MTIKHIIFHVTLASLVSFVYINISGDFLPSLLLRLFPKQPPEYSSVWCDGSDHTQRRCRFSNLCFKKDTKDFLFLHDAQNSLTSGIPEDRFSPALLELSAVSNHDKFYFNYVQIPADQLFSLQSSYDVKYVEDTTLIMSRFKPDNLMHLLHDDVLPTFFELNRLGWQQVDNLFLADDWPRFDDALFSSSQQLHANLFPRLNIRFQSEVKRDQILCFHSAFVGSSKSTVWYDYGFRKAQGPVDKSARESLLITTAIRKLTKQLISSHTCHSHYSLFVSRKRTRRILNEEELLKVISEVTDLPVVRIRIEEFTDFIELVKKFHCAKIVIGMHGSALILSMFLQPGSAVLELFPFAVRPEMYTPFKTLTNLTGMNIYYSSWRNFDKNSTVTHPEYPPEWGGIRHLPEDDQHEILSRTDDVPSHLCCSDTYWLFRIYQDTFIDSMSFSKTLKQLRDKMQKEVIANKFDQTSLLLNKSPPGPVQNSRCLKTISEEMAVFVIKWDEPWNLPLIKEESDLVQYELLIQKLPSNSGSLLATFDLKYQITDKHDSSYHIWIRCKINNSKGPFSLEPVSC